MTQIIADACANHLGDIRLIDKMIEEAAKAGVDFIKFQAFKADNLTNEWMHRYDYYRSVELKNFHYERIVDLCDKYGINPMFTVFHTDVIPILIANEVTHVKIASPDAENDMLVQLCYENFKQVIVSCGMGNPKRYSGIDYLYCISRYPTPEKDIDFEIMKLYDGFSDHTQGLTASKKAIDLGVKYIERHYTLGKYLPGNDHFLSSTPDEFKELVSYRNYKDMIPKYKNRWRSICR